jgi:restriction system protein
LENILTNEISQELNQSLLAPFIFMIMCSLIFIIITAVTYNLLLRRWIPEQLAVLAIFAGIAYIVLTCLKYYDEVKGVVESWNVTIMSVVMFVLVAFIGVIVNLIPKKKKRKTKRVIRKSSNYNISQRSRSVHKRTDQEILNTSLDVMSGADFERLLALYFQDQGYKVNEVGIGGKDGGVDLVITDHRGEKTAIQAKCYANHNLVDVKIVRELVAAKRNHDCILSLLITTSDLTGPARKEAEQFKVDYWHGGIIEQKLKTWGKWKPGNMK